jgi:hypothetical protein
MVENNKLGKPPNPDSHADIPTTRQPDMPTKDMIGYADNDPPTHRQDDTTAYNDYFTIEGRFNIVVFQLLELSAKIAIVVVCLIPIMSALSDILEELNRVLIRVAASMLSIGWCGGIILIVGFSLYIIGRFILHNY